MVLFPFAMTTDVYVSETVSESEFDGDARSVETLGFALEGVIGSVVENPDERVSVGSMLDREGAYTYEGTVYIVEESPTYLDYGVFEFDPFGEGDVIQ